MGRDRHGGTSTLVSKAQARGDPILLSALSAGRVSTAAHIRNLGSARMIEGKSDLVEVEIVLHRETDKAYLVSTDGKRDKAVWIPKSQCQQVDGEGQHRTMEMPEWLAIDRGLV
jgi:hypothetical protein